MHPDLPVPLGFSEPLAPRLLPIYQVTIEPWFQIYMELEDEGIHHQLNRKTSMQYLSMFCFYVDIKSHP